VVTVSGGSIKVLCTIGVINLKLLFLPFGEVGSIKGRRGKYKILMYHWSY
jgi:hypothetical protein